MILPSDRVMQAKLKIIEQGKDAGLSVEQCFEQMIALDPYDSFALVELGRTRQSAGDLAAAEQCYWRALEADPCAFQPYMALSQILAEDEAKSKLVAGVFELCLRKLLASEKALERFQEMSQDWVEQSGEVFGLKSREDIEDALPEVEELREEEPREVREQLRRYRWIHELQVAKRGLPRDLVDGILKHGEDYRPLLMGLLRGWWEGTLPKGDDFPAIASLALLGEIGNPAALSILVQMAGLDNETVGTIADVSIARITYRRAVQAVEAFREMAPGAETVDRCTIAGHLATMPVAGGKAELLLSLLDDLSETPKDEREQLFIAVAASLLITQGARGPEMVNSALSRHAKLLSKGARTSCNKLLKAHATKPLNCDEPPPESIVYEVCCPEGEEVEHEPGNRSRPERNSPCWCGSGKKYKKCHLAADEEESRQKAEPSPAPRENRAPDELGKLRERIGNFMERVAPVSEYRKGIALFFGKASMTRDPDEEDMLAFVDWLVHDHVLPQGRTVIEEFLLKNRSSLSERECQAVEQWSQSRISLWEVQEVRRGEGVQLKDLLRGGEFFVHDVNTSNHAARWDCILVRVEDWEGAKTMTGTTLTVPLPTLQPLRDWILADREKSGLPWPKYLRDNSHRIRQRTLKLAEDSLRSLHVTTGEGDEIVFSKATYKVLDRDAVRKALEASPAFGASDPNSFTWHEESEGRNAPQLCLGNARLERGSLILECQSRPRLERGRKLLEKMAPGALKHVGDEFTELEGVKIAAMSKETPEPVESSIPPEIERQMVQQVLAEHYRKWLDMSLPALDGKTPRQAAASAKTRGKLIALLKHFENGEERKRMAGEPHYDVSKLRAELGIEF